MSKFLLKVCHRVLIFALFFYLSPKTSGQLMVSPTKYDYTNLARSITNNASNDYEKARAIFDWMCENIAYDTSYSIRSADACYEQQKGVCQAYCELYYRLLEALGIRCVILKGEVKDVDGCLEKDLHSWIYVDVDGRCVLVDPTWGAGSLENNKFIKKKKDFWFDVDPYWMIFTHFPDDSQWQFITNPIDKSTFLLLPNLRPHCQYFGWDPQVIFHKVLNGKIKSFPKTFICDSGNALRLKDIPFCSNLKPASTYRFELENPSNNEFAIVVNGKTWYHRDLWTKTRNGYYIDLMPGEGGELSIAIKQPNGQYYYLIEYNVSYPTAKEQEYIIKNGPPQITPLDFEVLDLIQIPRNRLLNPAKTYRFEVDNPYNIDFALIMNSTWYKAAVWNRSGTRYWIDLMPSEGGELKLVVANDMGSYSVKVVYNVTTPTTHEQQYISSHQPPRSYAVDFESIKLIEVPKYDMLNPATYYHFEVEDPHNLNFALYINSTWYHKQQWEHSGTRYWINLLPSEGGLLKLAVQAPQQKAFYNVLEYQVIAPTNKEKEYIESQKPPLWYSLDFPSIVVVKCPKYGRLKVGETYRFEVNNIHNTDFAIIAGERWYWSSEWQHSGNTYRLDIKPTELGELQLVVKNRQNNYSTLVKYTVQ